ncbi:MAG TPA: hypothetical protein ENK02_16010 [Planctomycetes bacterium]|nr:hypothetical protein [Planctomycetota bacterium]
MKNSTSTPWKRWALLGLIGSIGISALMGIGVLLLGSFGATEEKILATTGTLAMFSLCSLVGGTYFEAREKRWATLAGLGLALAATLLLLTGIWGGIQGGEYWKFTGSLTVYALATAHLELLSIARLAQRFAWARVSVIVLTYCLATLVAGMIYADREGDAAIRILGVLSILVAALSILIPIFHRLSREELGGRGAGPAEESSRDLVQKPVKILCPYCQVLFEHAPGEILCPSCGGRFQLLLSRPK